MKKETVISRNLYQDTFYQVLYPSRRKAFPTIFLDFYVSIPDTDEVVACPDFKRILAKRWALVKKIGEQ